MASILAVNPGSTSTKLAIADASSVTVSAAVRHSREDLERYPHAWDQYDFRLRLCREWSASRLKSCQAVVAMGGLLRPLAGGVYRVNQRMIDDARANLQGEHVSNLGCALAAELGRTYGAEVFVVDPVSVDEFEAPAYFSGHPRIRRRSLSHALNIHAAARRAACTTNRELSSSSFVVAHLGGGISIAPVRGGRIIDVNDAASDGPFSPERTGGLPIQSFITLCFSGEYTEEQVRSLVMGNGGLVAYLGTNSVMEAEHRASAGDPAASAVLDAMAYQIAKEIGAMAAVLSGAVDAVVITGGAAQSRTLVEGVEQRVRFLAPVLVFPGDDEMRAMTELCALALEGKEPILEY